MAEEGAVVKLQQTSNNNDNNSSSSEEEDKTYECQYCDRKFYSSQALGGHQNGHKSQRLAARRAQKNLDKLLEGTYYIPQLSHHYQNQSFTCYQRPTPTAVPVPAAGNPFFSSYPIREHHFQPYPQATPPPLTNGIRVYNPNLIINNQRYHNQQVNIGVGMNRYQNPMNGSGGSSSNGGDDKKEDELDLTLRL